jgi:chromosome segregation ATPase
MQEPKKKIGAWIPITLYEDIEKAGYTSFTVAVTKGLELLLREHYGNITGTNGAILGTNGNNLGTIGNNLETSWDKFKINGNTTGTNREQLEIENKSLKNEIEKLNISLQETREPGELLQLRARSEELETKIKDLEENLRTAPNPVDLAKTQERLEGLQFVLDEKNNRINDLTKEIENTRQDKESIQNLYDNYMRQMQTLITQKAIEAPNAKKPWWRFW